MHNGPIDYRRELVKANNFLDQNNFLSAIPHYQKTVFEIERQILDKGVPLPEKGLYIYTSALFSLSKCYLESASPGKVLTLLAHSPVLFNPEFSNRALALKAKAYYQLGEKELAISTLKECRNDNKWDTNYIEGQCWLAALLIKDRQFNHAQQQVMSILEYLHKFERQNSNSDFWTYKIENIYQLGMLARVEHDDRKAVKLFRQAKADYDAHQHLYPAGDATEGIKKIALQLNTELLHCLIKLNEADEAQSLYSDIKLTDGLLLKVNNSIKIKVLSTWMKYTKLIYEQGKVNDAIKVLNIVVTWIQNGIMPAEFTYFPSIIAANLYLQPNNCHPDIALMFLRVVQKTPTPFKDQENVEQLLMQLICYHHLNDVEKATLVFNQLNDYLSKIESTDYVACYPLSKLMSLFPDNKDLDLLSQIQRLKLEWVKMGMEAFSLNDKLSMPNQPDKSMIINNSKSFSNNPISEIPSLVKLISKSRIQI